MVTKNAIRVCKQNCENKKFNKGIRNQKLGKVKFQVWLPEDFLSKGQKTTWGLKAPPPHGLEG